MWKPITTIFTLGVLVVASFWGATVLFGPKQPKTQSIARPQPIEQTQQVYAAPKNEAVTSIDGQKKLTLTDSTTGNNTTYTVKATNENGEETMTYTTTLPEGSTLSAPANAWSPDDKYIFMNGKVNDKLVVLVLQANGEPFSDTGQALDVTQLFTEKDNGYVMHEVTGWAAPGLLIVETVKPESETPNAEISFWFEIPSKNFIQLARHQ